MSWPRWVLALAAVALGVAGGGWDGWAGIVDLAVGLAFCWLGLLLREPRGRLARLMVITGFAWLAGGLATPLLLLHRGPLVHLLVSYPSGRAPTGTAALVVALAYLDAVAFPVGSNDWVTAALCGAVLATVIGSYLRSSGPERRARTVGLAATLAIMLVLGLGAAGRAVGLLAPEVVLAAYQTALLGTAVLIFISARSSPWRQATITGLVLELGELEHGGAQRARLARALGDPSVELAYWVPEAGGYVDIAGRPVEVLAGQPGRALTVLEHNGKRLGALVHDVAVEQDRALVDAVVSLAGIALANARLRAEVRAGVAAVEASRRRIVEAADAERRRLENELRDGAERRLVAVGELLEPDELRALLAGSLAELREFARGVHPRTLTESGLRPALTELAGRAELRVELTVVGSRLPPAVEAAVYFVCSEALANIVKHAGASVARIRVATGNTEVTAEIADDGAGGADPARGSGLRGLADRVGALGGTFHVDSPPGAGTRLVCRIPIT